MKWLFSSTCKKKNSKCKPEDILICSFDVDNNEIVGKRMDSEFYMSLRGKELCMFKLKWFNYNWLVSHCVYIRTELTGFFERNNLL